MTRQEILDKAFIGIEWEPQFTLPLYAGHQILFERGLAYDKYPKPSPLDFLTGIQPIKKKNKKNQFIQISNISDTKSGPSNTYFSHPNQILIRVSTSELEKFMEKRSREISKIMRLDDKKDQKGLFTDQLLNVLGIDGSNIEVRTIASSFKRLEDSIVITDCFLRLFLEKLNEHVKGGVGVFLPKTTKFELPQEVESGGKNGGKPELIFTPTKHVNITFVGMPVEDQYWLHKNPPDVKSFGTKLGFKSRKSERKRLHITVPYNFTDYADLIILAHPLLSAIFNHKPDSCLTPSDFIDVSEYYNKIMTYLNTWAKNNPQDKPILLKYVKNNKVYNQRRLI
jgi:hypothetical protein